MNERQRRVPYQPGVQPQDEKMWVYERAKGPFHSLSHRILAPLRCRQFDWVDESLNQRYKTTFAKYINVSPVLHDRLPNIVVVGKKM